MEIPKYTMVEKEDVDYFGFKIQEGEFYLPQNNHFY